MSVVGHLEELRRRLLGCAVAVVLGTAAAFWWRAPLLTLLLRPLPAAANAFASPDGRLRLAVTGVGEGFTVILELCLAAGVALATPVWLHQLWAFVAPALSPCERRWAPPFAGLGVLLFLAGLATGFVTLRYPIEWLLAFGDRWFVNLVTADAYFTFVAYFLLAFGLAFELPLVAAALAAAGLIPPGWLAAHRPRVLVGLWVVACVATPGADPVSPIILGTALSALHFVSEGLVAVIGRSRPIRTAPPGVVVGDALQRAGHMG